MADRDGKDPYRSYRFKIEIDGVTRAGFRECSGLDFSHDPVDYREGADPLNVRKLPGLDQILQHRPQVGSQRRRGALGLASAGDGRQGRAQERLHRPAERCR